MGIIETFILNGNKWQYNIRGASYLNIQYSIMNCGLDNFFSLMNEWMSWLKSCLHINVEKMCVNKKQN